MTAPARPLRSRRAASAVPAQFGRFLVVGAGNTALSLLVYDALVLAGTPYWGAGAVAFAAGAVNGYVLNCRWTFAAPDSAASRLRYLAVQLSGLALTTALLWLYVSIASVHRLWAYALAIPFVTLGTFAANRAWTFGGDSRAET